ncbi:MAG: MFS transporter [SAR202 cluster bacterium]|nr:MFS transporter [SAR202 cluster bacterium]
MTELIIQKQRRILLIFLFIGHTGIHWFKQMFPVILPYIKQDLELSNVEAATIVTANEVASGGLTVPSGIVADKYYKHRAIILGGAVGLCGLAYFFVGFFANYLFVILGFMVLGLASALWHPPAQSSLSTFFPDKRGFALAVHGVGASIGDSIGPLLIGFILVSVGWVYLSTIQFAVAIPLGIIVFIATKNHFNTSMESPTLSSYISGIGSLVKNPYVLTVMFGGSFTGMARLAIFAFLGIYLTEYLGYSSVWYGINWALLYVMGIVSQPIMGYLSDKFSRKTVVLPALLILAICYFLLPLAPNPIILGIIIAIMGMFFYGISNITTAAVLDVASSQLQGTSTSVEGLFRQIFTLPSPIIAGIIIDSFGITYVFYYAAAMVFIGSIFWMFIKIPKS